MTILVRKALIIDPHSPHHQSVQDLFIENGVITRIGSGLTPKAEAVIENNNMIVSPGWIDIFSHFNDPGFEQKETLDSGAAAAIAGGYTRVCVVPNTHPVIDGKGQVEYIVQKSKALPVHIHPLGALTKGCAGNELSEMYDMHHSGAIAFTDGTAPLQPAGLLLKALQYVKAFDGVVIQVPNDDSIAAHGLVNEGVISTQLGLPGIPSIAEELMIKRDIDLARYTDSRIHFTGVSTANSIQLIQQARAEGVAVSCSVTPYHLMFSDEMLESYDTNFKVMPPLRSKADVVALREAVMNGAVDCIAAHHLPQHLDNKACEFEYAKYGMIGLESCFTMVNTALPGTTDEMIANLFSINPAKLFNLPLNTVVENSPASLTLFTRKGNNTFTLQQVKSRSSNTPATGMQLSGKVIGVINKGKVFLN